MTKILIDKTFLARNTDFGIRRFLSTKGFDVNREWRLEKGPTKRTFYAVQDDEVAVVEEPEVSEPPPPEIKKPVIKGPPAESKPKKAKPKKAKAKKSRKTRRKTVTRCRDDESGKFVKCSL